MIDFICIDMRELLEIQRKREIQNEKFLLTEGF